MRNGKCKVQTAKCKVQTEQSALGIGHWASGVLWSLVIGHWSFLPAFGQVPPPATAPEKVEWSGQDIAGRPVKVPAPDRPTVLLFAMADQAQSNQAIEQAKAVLEKTGVRAQGSGPPTAPPPGPGAAAPAAPPPASAFQVAAVITGAGVEAAAKKLADEGKWPFPVVIDRDYAISGRMGVHVWPTTLVISSAGEPLAHLAGLPGAYAADLEAHLAFAAGRITREELAGRLAAHRVVAGTPEQVAHRHLLVAERLLEKDLLDQARQELARGLAIKPDDPALQAAMIRVLILQNQLPEAQAGLDKLDASRLPPWQVALLRGRLLLAQGQFDQAVEPLARATQLNPNPAEAFYALGLVHQRRGDWQRSAAAFRSAFEATPVGREVAPATQPAGPAGLPGE